ncbi:MAG: aminotransferase class IV, partial [Flammeovirgaceae bacterium]|nr:aminotransferase class IV [Flammeovirgaceae bacterium]MDW8288115.1 aminotransferase class IV [Flammeovirgaceae bacterium]
PARVKLIVWRKEGGRYTPTDNRTHFLLTTEPYQSPPTKTDTHVSICRTITLFPHSLSPFKCCSLPYVVAGIEKKERKLDDIILLNHKGYLVECLVSNLFWKKDGIIFTPSLSTGCIDGVFRKNLLAFFRKIGQPYAEVEAPLEELFLAQSVFTTNVAGIRHVLNVDSYSYLPLPDTEEWEKMLLD